MLIGYSAIDCQPEDDRRLHLTACGIEYNAHKVGIPGFAHDPAEKKPTKISR